MNLRIKVYLVIFLSKIFLFLFFASYLKDEKKDLPYVLPSWEQDEGYLSSTENLLKYGTLYYDGNFCSKDKCYAIRVPGQSLTYYFFRVFLSEKWALTSLLFFQVLLFSLALSEFLLYLFEKLGNSSTCMMFSIVILCIDTYSAYYNNVPCLAESITISLMIFAILFFLKFLDNGKNSTIFFSGIFAALTFFFKVAAIIILLILLMYLLITWFKMRKNSIVIKIGLLVAPFLILEGIWIFRNYYNTSEFIPLQEVKSPNPQAHNFLSARIEFCQSFGGDWVRWNPNSAMFWFEDSSYINEMGFNRPQDAVFPKFIFSKSCSLNELKEIRNLNWNGNPDEATRRLKLISSKIKENHPIQANVINRLKYSYGLFFESPTYYFPYAFEGASWFEKGIKLLSLFMCILAVVVPLFFLPFYLFKFKILNSHLYNLLYAIAFANIFLYAIVFKTQEFRYNLISYIPFLLLTTIIFFELNKRFNKSGKLLNPSR